MSFIHTESKQRVNGNKSEKEPAILLSFLSKSWIYKILQFSYQFSTVDLGPLIFQDQWLIQVRGGIDPIGDGG